MIDDPIVAEVRNAREKFAARFGHDLKAMVADIRARQGKDGGRVVSLPPKRRAATK